MSRGYSRQHAGWFRVAVDAMHGDRVVPAIGGHHKIARRVDGDTTARVELAREGFRECGDRLDQRDRRLAPVRGDLAGCSVGEVI